MGTGSVYCQLLDMLYPGKVAMSKVNWKAKLEYEFLQNLKILQNSFIALKIGRMIEIERLSKAKYQDNLEFIQWFKRFFEMRSVTRNETYDPLVRRGNVMVDFSFAEKIVIPKFNNPLKIKQQQANISEKKESLKENVNIASYDSVKNQNKKIVFEEKPKKPIVNQQEKIILQKIQMILVDGKKEEMMKLREIYEVMGVKTFKEVSKEYFDKTAMEEETL